MYSKYHGCGNDFLIGIYKSGIDYSNIALTLCNRYTGFGADGLLLAKKNDDGFEMVFYNADGSKAPMCGNGLRCFAAFLVDQKLTKTLSIKTAEDHFYVEKINDEYLVNMKKPSFDCIKLGIPFEIFNYELVFKDVKYFLNAIYMTTHHLVIRVDSIEAITSEIGHYFCTHSLFKYGINVNFVEVIDQFNIKVKTYERGVGFTKACGSGSCACLVILNKLNLVKTSVLVHLEYGVLQIKLENDEVFMQGPAIKIGDILTV